MGMSMSGTNPGSGLDLFTACWLFDRVANPFALRASLRFLRGRVMKTCRHAGRPVSDAQLVAATAAELSAFASTAPAPRGAALALVETAGGPASPGPSGRLQVACPALRLRRTMSCAALLPPCSVPDLCQFK